MALSNDKIKRIIDFLASDPTFSEMSSVDRRAITDLPEDTDNLTSDQKSHLVRIATKSGYKGSVSESSLSRILSGESVRNIVSESSADESKVLDYLKSRNTNDPFEGASTDEIASKVNMSIKDVSVILNNLFDNKVVDRITLWAIEE